MLRLFSSSLSALRFLQNLWHNRVLRRILLLLLALWSFDQLVTLVTEGGWMASLGLSQVWRTRVWTQLMLGTTALLMIVGCGSLFVRPLARVPRPAHNVTSAYQILADRMSTAHERLVRAACLIVGLLAAYQSVRLASNWQDWMLFAHGQRWSGAAPVFGYEPAFYLFRLGWWHRVLDVAWTCTTILLGLVALLTVTQCILLIVARELHGAPRWIRTLRPLLVAAALWFALRAAGYYLEPFDIVAGASGLSGGPAAGLLLVDQVTSRIGLTACLLMVALCLLPALAAGFKFGSNVKLPVLASGFNLRRWRTLRWILILAVCALLIPTIAFRLFQGLLSMTPSSPNVVLTDEGPQNTGRQQSTAQNRAGAVRAAWNLDAVQVHLVTVGHSNEAGGSVNAPPVPFEVPVWDETRLGSAAQGHLASATAAGAAKPVAHIDRYARAGIQELIGVAGLEPHSTQTRANTTRDSGDEPNSPDLVVLSASRIGRERSPVTIALAEVKEGQQSDRLRTGSKAADAAPAGPLASDMPSAPWWQRLLWAWRLRDLSLLGTHGNSVGGAKSTGPGFPFHRSMRQCAQQIAPFLVVDGEPYPIVTPSGVVWMLDLLSASTSFPLVSSTQRAGALRGYNAARDSVKMTMDKRTGQIAFYASHEGENDPLLQPWRRGFPSLVRPWREMPASLREHCRYPRALFEVQRDALQRTAEYSGGSGSSAATYSLWPDGGSDGQRKSRFVLQGTLRDGVAQSASDVNEVAVLIADCDNGRYGRLQVFRFQQRRASTRTGAENRATIENVDQATRLELGQEPTHRVLVPVGLTWPSPTENDDASATAQRLLTVAVQYAPGGEKAGLNQVLVSDALDVSQRSGIGTDLERAWRRFWGEDELPQPRPVSDLTRQALSTHEMVQRAASSGDWTGFDFQRKKLRAILQELHARSESQNAQQTAP